jgi:hypothetical protein
MYLRQTKRSNKDGSDAMYFQIAENVWSKANKRSEVKVLHNFGRVDPESEQRLRKLAESILKRLNGAPGAEAAIDGDDCKLRVSQTVWNFGSTAQREYSWMLSAVPLPGHGGHWASTDGLFTNRAHL